MFDYSQLDPGVRETVRLLHVYGFRTSDSGDGVSKTLEERVLHIPHVAVFTSRTLLLEEADRLWTIVQSIARELDRVAVEASYSPIDKQALIMLYGLNDSMLKGTHG